MFFKCFWSFSLYSIIYSLYMIASRKNPSLGLRILRVDGLLQQLFVCMSDYFDLTVEAWFKKSKLSGLTFKEKVIRVFASTKSDFIVFLSFQPDGGSLWYFKLTLFIRIHSQKYLRSTTLGCKLQLHFFLFSIDSFYILYFFLQCDIHTFKVQIPG